MSRGRLLFYCCLLCLPAVVLTGVCIFFCVGWAPRLIRNEPRRLTMLYRDEAEELKSQADSITPIRTRPVGPANGKIDGWPWGYRVHDGQATVWVQSLAADGKREWRLKETVVHEAIPYGWLYYGGGSLITLGAIIITAIAVGCFVRFVKEREDFLAATAHDLTTPLVAMRRIIGRNDAEAKVINERMIRLVQNLKDFLKLGGRPRPKLQEFDLLAAYREAYGLFAADYRDLFGGADVTVEGGEGVLTVFADETMTVQILWNLLGNDLKYAAPYGRVKVCFSHADGFVKVEFADEGQGMTRRQMRKAFDRYYRAKTVLESGKGGFGIGLCTAKEFARAMGGDLTVRPNAPQGCIFALALPTHSKSARA